MFSSKLSIFFGAVKTSVKNIAYYYGSYIKKF